MTDQPEPMTEEETIARLQSEVAELLGVLDSIMSEHVLHSETWRRWDLCTSCKKARKLINIAAGGRVL